MSEGKLFEVRGQYTVTVAKAIWARDEQEAMDIAEELNLDLTTYANGTVGVEDYGTPGDEAICEADGYLEWNEADENFYYTDEKMDDYDKEQFEEEYWDERPEVEDEEEE